MHDLNINQSQMIKNQMGMSKGMMNDEWWMMNNQMDQNILNQMGMT